VIPTRQQLARALAVVGMAAAVAASADALAQSRPPSRPPAAPPPHSSPVVAQATEDAAPVTGPVSIEILCVRGTKSDAVIDSSLRTMAPKFKNLAYTGYHLVDSHSDDVAVGDTTTFTIEGGRRVRIEVLDRDAEAARLRIQMFEGTRAEFDTTISIHRNRSFIVAGPKIGEDVLILPVTVNY
jgi:hypothetical protein